MKATTTYNTNTLNKGIMKRFYFKKYITVISILTILSFSCVNLMGQNVSITATTATTTDIYKLGAGTTYTNGSGETQLTFTPTSMGQKNGTRCAWGVKKYYPSFGTGGILKIALPTTSSYYISKIEIDLASNSTSTLNPAGHYGYSTDPTAAFTSYTDVTNYTSLSYNTCSTVTINPTAGTLAVAFGRAALGGVGAVGNEHLIFEIRVWLTGGCSGTTDTPVITSTSLCPAGTTVSGTSTEANGTAIEVFKAGTTSIGTGTVTSNAWSITTSALTAGDVITAKATSSTECVSAASTSVTVQQTSATPVVSSPIDNGATSVSGTSSEADGTSIEIFVDAGSVGTTTVSSGAWTKGSLSALSTGDVVTAKATATGKCVSATSTGVTVTAPCAAGTPAIADPTNTCAGTGITFSASGTPAAGDTWYWQTSSSGTSTANNATSNYTTATTAGSYTIYLRSYNTAGDCWSTAVSKTATINALPTITVGSTSISCAVGSDASWTYTATTGNTYSIDWSAGGPTDVTDVTISTSPVTISASGLSAGTYTGTLTVKNTTTNCVSTGQTLTLVVSAEVCGVMTGTASSAPYDFGDYTLYFSDSGTSYTGTGSGTGTGTATSYPTRVWPGADFYIYDTYAIVYLENSGATAINFRGHQDSNRSISSVYTSSTLSGTYSVLGSYTASNYTTGSVGTMGISNVTLAQGTYVLFTFSGDFRTSGLCVTPIYDQPQVSTQAADNITAAAGRLNGTIISTGTSAISASGFVWKTSTGPTLSDNVTTGGPTTAIAYDYSLSGLNANTNYYVKAYATNTSGTTYGGEVILLTKPGQATIAAESSVTSSGFTANWTAPAGQGAATFTYTLEYGTDNTFATKTTVSDIASGTTSYAVSGLSANTNYYYRVKAVNASGDGAYTASYQTVTTLSGPPTVTTTSVSNILADGADGGGNVTSDGGSAITARGTAYATTANPTTGTSNGTGTGVFSSTLSSLNPNTLYYYRAYATNTNGTSYGTESSFTTLPNAPTVGTGNAITGVGFTANWTAPAIPGSATYTYTLEVDTVGGTFTTPKKSYTGITSGTLSQVVTGLYGLSGYIYRVRCVNTTGGGSWSATSATVTTLAQKTLTVTIDPGAGGTVTAEGNAVTSGVAVGYTENDVITLLATPASGYGFLRWTINGSQVSNNPYEITMSENKTVTATFGTASCGSTGFEDVVADVDLSDGSDDDATFDIDGESWSFNNCRLNTSSTYAHAGNQSIQLSYTEGYIITKSVARPISLSFYARNRGNGDQSTVIVYISTDGGSTFEATPILSEVCTSDATFSEMSVDVSTSSSDVVFKIFNDGGSSGSTDFNVYVDDVEICQGPDGTAPTLTFSPLNTATGVALDANLTITSDEALYRYYPLTSTYVELTTAALSGMSADSISQFMWLTDQVTGDTIPAAYSIDATGKIITVNPTSDFAEYSRQYRLSIKNVADANDNAISSTQYTQFTTRPVPAPEIKIELVSSNADIALDEDINMGTVIDGTTIDKIFRIINTALLDDLTISSCGWGTGSEYAIISDATYSNLTDTTVAAGDTILFKVRFTPGSTTGTYTNQLTINNNDMDAGEGSGAFTIDFIGGKAAFTLPYKYESGLSTPVYTEKSLYQDYTTLTDIPSEITRNGNNAIVEDVNFFDAYSVFQVEGNCMPSGNSALRVGRNAGVYNNGLEIDLAEGCGQVTVKWCSNGYRKIKLSNGSNIYEESASFQPGGVCYTTTSVINDADPITLDIEFIGPDSSLLTTIYYLEITPYDPTLKSSAKNILSFSTGEPLEDVRIFNDAIFVSVPSSVNLSTITPTDITPSPFATVSPAESVQQDFSSGAVTYTVTAENGSTKTYQVFVEHQITFTGHYNDTIEFNITDVTEDQILEVIEISNSSCVVPTSGNGSIYTIHHLDETDLPSEGYNIGGLNQVCIGSTSCYSLTNAPVTNNPNYIWKVAGDSIQLFTPIGVTGTLTYDSDTNRGIDTLIVEGVEELCLQAPNDTTAADLSLSLSVIYEPLCAVLQDTAEIQIEVNQDAPTAVTSLECACVYNGLLTITAKGAGSSATTYGWTFSPTTTVVSQSDSTIVINLGSADDDFTAQIVTQNGCGVTPSTGSIPIDYATQTSTWTGTVDSDWDDPDNWDGRVPTECTNVIIPNVNSISVNYPEISTSGVCNYITFEPGGAVKGLDKLTYNKAFVKQSFARRNHWYTLTAPLKEMYSGDFYFNGAPEALMKLFDTTSPDAVGPNTLYEGTFTRSFANLTTPLTSGLGFAFNVSETVWNYPSGPTTDKSIKTVTFPRMNTDSSLVSSYIPYNSRNGYPYTTLTKTVTKDTDDAYRFALENTNGLMTNDTVTIQTGYNLVGNPIMTHLDISAFLSTNATTRGAITNKIYLWTGSAYETYDGTSWDGTYTGNYIAPMQSFVVDGLSTGPLSVVFDLSTHFDATDGNSALRSTSVNTNKLFIKAKKDGITTGTVITNNATATNGFDNNDIYKLFTPLTEVADVYTSTNGYAVAFNKFNQYPFTAPLGIKTSAYGKVNLSFEGAESFNEAEVYLLNSLTGEQINLKEQTSYEVELTPENAQGTMFVEFRSATVKNNLTSNNKHTVQIFTKDNNTVRVISSASNPIKEVTIMDEVGRTIQQNNNLNQTVFDTVLNNGSKIVIVKVRTEYAVEIAKVLIK